MYYIDQTFDKQIAENKDDAGASQIVARDHAGCIACREPKGLGVIAAGEAGIWMNVTVTLVGAFREGRFHEEVREYPPGTSVQGVIEALGLPATLFGTALVNGVHAAVDKPLQDGDALCLLPMIDGG